jgi:hypothetical protein
VICACLPLAACATTVAGHPSAVTSEPHVAGSPSTAPAGESSPAGSAVLHQELADVAASDWVRVSDARSGVGFKLPKQPTRSARTQAGVDERLYTAQVNGNDLGVTFGIIDLGSTAKAAATLTGYADGIAAEFHSAGATDFAITEKRDCTYDTHACQDMRIGFTPTSKPDETTLWLIRIVADGTHILLLQTIAGAPKTEQQPDLTLVRQIQHRLVNSVAIS